MTLLNLLVAATVLALLLMTAAYLLARGLRNFSIVDVAWSFNFTPIAMLFATLGSGEPGRRIAVLVMVALWSLRLAYHLSKRIAALHPVEEGRYLELRRQWAPNVNRRFLGFFLFQGILNVVLSIPFLFASLNPSPRISPLEVAGLAVFGISLALESLADAQLHAFRKDPSNAGKVCQVGLWRYSRHPNYFFEWLVWCAFALIATAAPWGLVSWICPAMMLYFLLRVTGIPATEEQAVRSRGDAYREYQATTSAFVPWPPRSPR